VFLNVVGLQLPHHSAQQLIPRRERSLLHMAARGGKALEVLNHFIE